MTGQQKCSTLKINTIEHAHTKENGQEKQPCQGKILSNLSQDILSSKDVSLDVEAKVENGVTNALLNLKKQNINQTLSKLTGTSELQHCSESIYEIHF